MDPYAAPLVAVPTENENLGVKRSGNRVALKGPSGSSKALLGPEISTFYCLSESRF